MGWDAFFAGVVVFGASIIRGYSGFGFAMVCALTLSYLYPPSQITPMVLCMDVAASTWLFWKSRKEVDWKGLKLIGLGALASLPLGTLALVVVPANPMRICIALIILCLCIALARQKKRMATPGPAATTVVGLCSGFLTGVAALGGPPVILFYFSSDRPVAVSRASMIAFFLMVDIMALVSSIVCGLVTTKVMALSMGMFLPLALGIWLGNFLFHRYANETAFRRQVILFLMFFAVVSLVKFTLFHSP